MIVLIPNGFLRDRQSVTGTACKKDQLPRAQTGSQKDVPMYRALSQAKAGAWILDEAVAEHEVASYRTRCMRKSYHVARLCKV